MRLPILPALIGCLAPSVFAEEPPPRIFLDEQPGIALGREVRPPALPPASKGLQEFTNGDFEQVTGGEPDNWRINGSPGLRTEGENTFARANSQHFYVQRTAAPPPSGRHVGFTAEVRAPTGMSLVAVFSGQDSDPEYFFQRSRTTVQTSGWTRIYGTHVVMGTQPGFDFWAAGADGLNWTDVDNLAVFDESPAAGDFEAPLPSAHPAAWQLSGGASLVAGSILQPSGSTQLVLPSGGSARVLTASLDRGQQYFTTLRQNSDTFGGALDIAREQWGFQSMISAETDTIDPVGTLPGRRVFFDTPDADANAAYIELTNSGTTTISVDDVSRGFTQVWPSVYHPGPDSPNPELRLSAAWPRELTSGTAIISPAGETTEIAVLQLDVEHDVGTVFWDGSGVPAGDYEVRFVLNEDDGDSFSIIRPFTLEPRTFSANADPVQSSVIRRGAWIWLLNEDDDINNLRPFLAQAKADGYNFAMIFARQAQWAAVAQAAEEVGLEFIAGDFVIQNLVKQRLPGIAPISAELYESTLQQELAPALASPMNIGVYLVDEPDSQWQLDSMENAARVVRERGHGGAYATITPPIAARDGIWDEITTSVNWGNLYPMEADDADAETAFAELADYLETQVPLATERGREFWLVGQSFSDAFSFINSPNAGARATVGISLALGAKGWVPFIYNQITVLEGVRTDELEPLPGLETWVEQHERVARADTELASLTGHTRFGITTGPVVVSNASSASVGDVLFLASHNPDEFVDVTLEFDAPAELVELTGEEPRRAFASTHTLRMEPGGWRAWIRSGGEIASADASVVSQPAGISLPVVADVTPLSGGNDVDIAPTEETYLVAGAGRVAWINSDGTKLFELFAISPESVDFISNRRAFVSQSTFGLGILDLNSQFLGEAFAREPGSALDALVADPYVWVNHDYLGLRRLDLGPNGNLSNPVYDRFSTSPREVAGLLASGEVFVPDYLDGLLAAEVDNGSIQERTLDSASTIRDGDVSPSGTRIAVTLMRRGIALVEIDGSGSVLQRNEVQLTPEYVREVQWISEEMLAVVLYDGRVLFTEIGSDLSTRVRSQWVPSPAADFAVADAEARNNRLALLFGDGRLIVLDVSNIPETESDSWHLR